MRGLGYGVCGGQGRRGLWSGGYRPELPLLLLVLGLVGDPVVVPRLVHPDFGARRFKASAGTNLLDMTPDSGGLGHSVVHRVGCAGVVVRGVGLSV